jgi:hypothetical protein
MVVTAFSSGDSLPVTRGRPVGGWHDAHAAIALQHRECLICSGLGASAWLFGDLLTRSLGQEDLATKIFITIIAAVVTALGVWIRRQFLVG